MRLWHVDSDGVVADRSHWWLAFGDEGPTAAEQLEFARRNLEARRADGGWAELP